MLDRRRALTARGDVFIDVGLAACPGQLVALYRDGLGGAVITHDALCRVHCRSHKPQFLQHGHLHGVARVVLKIPLADLDWPIELSHTHVSLRTQIFL